MSLAPSPYTTPLAAFGIGSLEWDRFRAPYAAAHVGTPDGAAKCTCGAPATLEGEPEACRVLRSLVWVVGAASGATVAGVLDSDTTQMIRVVRARLLQDGATARTDGP